jgi:hypothetical protein
MMHLGDVKLGGASRMKFNNIVVALATVGAAFSVYADITVGVTLSATGPAASLGIPEKNTIALLPATIAGQKVSYIVLDDASDTTTAVKNVRKLISENHVDIIIGSTITPNSLAIIDVVAEAENTGHFDGGFGADCRSGKPEDQVDVQDPAARPAHGDGHRRPHGGPRHQDRRIHRFQ